MSDGFVLPPAIKPNQVLWLAEKPAEPVLCRSRKRGSVTGLRPFDFLEGEAPAESSVIWAE